MSGRSVPGVRVVFAGGGSGGHLAPALAVSERLADADPAGATLFLCSERAIDAEMLSAHDVRFEALPSQPWSRSPGAAWRFLRGQGTAVRTAIGHLKRFDPHVVVAVGGFASVAGVLAAARLGVRRVLYNLDVLPGRANRLVRPLCSEVVSSVTVSHRRGFDRVIGPPIRREALPPAAPGQCRRQLGLDPERPTLLVTGASQGSASLNRLMVEWLAQDSAGFAGWQVLHLTGGGDPEPARESYRQAGVAARVEAFAHPMGLAWGAASLAITRAGANSVAEVHAAAVPAVLVPYPHHRDRHQWLNAAPLVALGGAVVVEDRIDPRANMASIAAAARRLMGDHPRRAAMSRALREHPPSDGASVLANELLRLRR